MLPIYLCIPKTRPAMREALLVKLASMTTREARVDDNEHAGGKGGVRYEHEIERGMGGGEKVVHKIPRL